MGIAWLDRIPKIVTACAERWNITPEQLLTPLTYNYLLSAHCDDGSRVIIKVCTPDAEYPAQKAALLHFAGHGAIRLLASDDDGEVLLLEACEPGTRLVERSDDEAIVVAASVMRPLRRPLPPQHPFPTLGDWGQGLVRLRQFYAGTGPFPAEIVERAERMFTEYGSTTEASVLLHGDLHHDNILAAQRQPWLAIDPKGVAGEPAYETATFVINAKPVLRHATDPATVLRRRVDRFAAELEI